MSSNRSARRIVAATIAGGLIVVAAVAVLMSTGRSATLPSAKPDPSTGLGGLAARCASSLNPQGAGEITLTVKTIISNETGEITVPCKVTLARGASLVLNNVTLRSRHLLITDDGPNGATDVRIDNSTLQGVEPAGFGVNLSDAADSFAMHHSNVTYGLSVYVGVFGQGADAPGGGRIEVADSTVTSLGPSSDGIGFVASGEGGRGTFTHDTFVTKNGTDTLLFAGTCHAQGITGAPENCSKVTR